MYSQEFKQQIQDLLCQQSPVDQQQILGEQALLLLGCCDHSHDAQDTE